MNIGLLLQSVRPPRFDQDSLDLEAWILNSTCPKEMLQTPGTVLMIFTYDVKLPHAL